MSVTFLLTFPSCGSGEKDDSTGKPNILFILADDQSFNTVHALGNDEIITPTLDELAENGTVFRSVYNMGGWNGAVCIASRTMFNTGRFIWHADELSHNLDSVAVRGELWSQVLDSLGYDTYMTGKWHVNIKPSKIFNTVGTVRGGMPKQTPQGYNRPLSPDDTTWTPWDTTFGGFWQGGTHWTEVVANETIGFLDSAAKSEHPFFMYVAFNAPHDPRQSPKEYVDMYPVEEITLPENFLTGYPYKDEIGCPRTLRDEKLAPMPRTPYAVKVNRQEYYAIITHLDHELGRILDHIEATGLDENTYIIYSADHGLACGQHGFLGKQNMYEHSMKPPMIIVGPDVPKGARRDMQVYLQDIMPTVIEYAGGEVPPYVEFNSLKAFIDGGKTGSEYPAIYGAYRHLQRMVRKDDYKLIVYPQAGIMRLYNLASDPLEMEDLAADPAQHERMRTLFIDLLSLQEETGDTLNLKRFQYQPFTPEL